MQAHHAGESHDAGSAAGHDGRGFQETSTGSLFYAGFGLLIFLGHNVSSFMIR